MIWATEYKHVDLVKLLLSKGSDINIRDNVSLPPGRRTLEDWGRVCRVAVSWHLPVALTSSH